MYFKFFFTLLCIPLVILTSEQPNKAQLKKPFLRGSPILSEKAKGALLALKNLPQELPVEIKRIIAHHFVWENLNDEAIWLHLRLYGSLNNCKEAVYTEKQLFFIAYEFISDDCHNIVRTKWLTKLFKRLPAMGLYKPTALYMQITDRWILDLNIPNHYHYPKITESELCYDSKIHEDMERIIKQMAIHKSLKSRKLNRLLSKKVNPENTLIHQAIILATENNHFTLLYKLSTDFKIDLCNVKAIHNKNLLYFVTRPEMVNFLVAYDLNIMDVQEYISPLLSAFYGRKFQNGQQQVTTVQKLLEKGAIVTEEIEKSPCDRAMRCGCSSELYRFLKEKF